MNIFENKPSRSSNYERESSPLRFQMALEAVKFMIGNLEVKGKEHLKEIPADRKVVIACTHMSDLDMPVIALALAKDFNLALSDQSTHHDFKQDPGNYAIHKIAGDKNFIPIDYKTNDGKKTAQFNPDNFNGMTEAMNNGKDFLFAAHNPSSDGSLTSGGIGAVYLAQLTHALIVPVSANFKTNIPYITGQTTKETLDKKPDAEVIIDKYIDLEPITGIEDYQRIFNKRREGQKLSPEEVDRFMEISRALREQAEVVMNVLKEGVPEEKRGPYKAP